MAFNPCCMPLQRGVMILAIIGVVLDCLIVIGNILTILAVTVWKDELEKRKYRTEYDVAIGTLILSLILAILGLLLSIRLYVGAKNRDQKQCKIWLFITLIITILDVIGYIVNGTSGSVVTANIIGSILSVVFTLYKMLVVYAFIQEIKSDNALHGFQARLEEGTNAGPVFQMQQYPPPPYAQQQPPVPGYPVQQQGSPYVVQQSNGPSQNIIYNPNSPYVNRGNM